MTKEDGRNSTMEEREIEAQRLREAEINRESSRERGFFERVADKARSSFYNFTHNKLAIALTVGAAITVLATGGLAGIAGAGILGIFAACNIVDNIAEKFGVQELNSFGKLLKVAATPVAFVADQVMNVFDKDREVTFTQAIWGDKSKSKDESARDIVAKGERVNAQDRQQTQGSRQQQQMQDRGFGGQGYVPRGAAQQVTAGEYIPQGAQMQSTRSSTSSEFGEKRSISSNPIYGTQHPQMSERAQQVTQQKSGYEMPSAKVQGAGDQYSHLSTEGRNPFGAQAPSPQYDRLGARPSAVHLYEDMNAGKVVVSHEYDHLSRSSAAKGAYEDMRDAHPVKSASAHGIYEEIPVLQSKGIVSREFINEAFAYKGQLPQSRSEGAAVMTPSVDQVKIANQSEGIAPPRPLKSEALREQAVKILKDSAADSKQESSRPSSVKIDSGHSRA